MQIRAIDDFVDEANVVVTHININMSSTDALYNNMANPGFDVNVTDNDTARVRAYAQYYQLDLYSNFTFLNDPHPEARSGLVVKVITGFVGMRRAARDKRG